MKKTKRFISFLLVVQMMLMCTLIQSVAALEAMEESLIVNENKEELMPMMARGCSNYEYAYRGMDMDAVAAENGWTMNGKYILENGIEIGRYDDGSNGQDPHFHLYSTPGMHYILA